MKHKSTHVGTVAFLICLALVAGFGAAGSSVLADNNSCTGRQDTACNVVNGFGGNQALDALGATIAGGGMPYLPNRVLANGGTIGGGMDNQAGSQATVSGGASNFAAGYRATVGGGSDNTAHTAYSTIGGGINNLADGLDATISGGTNNHASARDATIAGGSGNIASFTLSTVSGGSYNTASSLQATVGGGSRNTAGGAFSTVSGGSDNRAQAFDSTVSGGSGNRADADDTSIGGGLGNGATDKYSTIGGGYRNSAGNDNEDPLDAQYATVSGGSHNQASGAFSSVPGGSHNSAGADFAFAAGRRAIVDSKHQGSILFADSTEADFRSSSSNEFAVRATGGVRLVTATDGSGNSLSGVQLAPGGGSWQVLSDQNAKTNLAPVNRRQILAQVANLPLSTWSYKTQDTLIRHIGPMSQDFAQFGVGEDARYINQTDENGVALAAIQGLYELVQEQAAEIDALRAEQTSHASGGYLSQANVWLSPMISLLFGAAGVLVGSRLGKRH